MKRTVGAMAAVGLASTVIISVGPPAQANATSTPSYAAPVPGRFCAANQHGKKVTTPSGRLKCAKVGKYWRWVRV